MVRNYKRKRESTSPDSIRQAFEHYLNSNDGYKKSAQRFDVPPGTLHTYINTYNNLPESEKQIDSMSFGYRKMQQIFSDAQEAALVVYLKHAASIYFGLSPRDVRVLAYECATKFKVNMPLSWPEKGMAGADWFSGFLKRHSAISLRTLEATSIARATAFNKINVAGFFQKLAEVYDRYKFNGSDIWNADETGIMTVVKPNKVVASTGTKQVGSLASAERGQLVTMCCAASAAGQAIPPFLIYPRVYFKDHFIRGAPPGTKGVAYPSGWMTGPNFLEFIKHFVEYVKPTTEKPVLLLLDNHESHLYIEVLDYAKNHGVVLLSFPPHCSHKLQPLDVSVFSSLKGRLSHEQSKWLRNHPGKPITIQDTAEISCKPWQEAFCMRNICSGFEKSGIYPFNDNIFSDDDFAPATVTDRPSEEQSTVPAEDPGPPAQSIEGLFQSQDNDAAIKQYLENRNLSLIPVRGNGHCLLYALGSALHAESAGTYTDDDLGKILTEEFTNHQQFYSEFVAADDLDLASAVNAFVHEKQYNNDTCDMFLNALCSAMNIKAVIIRVTDGTVNELDVLPSRPGVETQHTVYLTLHGNGLAAHYNAASSKSCRSTEDEAMDSSRNIAGQNSSSPDVSATTSSGTPRASATTSSGTPRASAKTSSSESFSPESVKPHPKAPKRTQPSTNRKRRKTCILTDTPEKEALRAEQEISKANREAKLKKAQQKGSVVKEKLKATKKQSVKAKRASCKNKSKKKGARQQNEVPCNTRDEDECYCLVCLEPYSNSLPNEKWIQCSSCKLWSHDECADIRGIFSYMCHNCESDDDN